MTLEEKLYNHISNDSNLVTLQSARVYPIELPADIIYPCSTFERISTTPWNDRQLSNNHRVRLQIDCFAKTYIGVNALASAYWTSLLPLRSASSPRIINVQLASRRDGPKDEVGVFRVSLDFFVTFDQE